MDKKEAAKFCTSRQRALQLTLVTILTTSALMCFMNATILGNDFKPRVLFSHSAFENN